MISIIIPVFNSKKYLNKCIESIIKQTYTDIEIILIDDGSTDGSGEICDKFSILDRRVKVIHQPNAGVSSARNYGLDIAKGSLIMFVDSDDWVESCFIENLLRVYSCEDILISGYKELRPSRVIIKNTDTRKIESAELFEHFEELYEKFLLNSPFSKLYKRNLIDNLRFRKDVKLGEDLIFNLEYIKKTRNILFVDEIGYNYNCINQTSATKTFREDDIDQLFCLHSISKEFVKNYPNVEKINNIIEKRLCVNIINIIQLAFESKKYQSYKKMIQNKILLNNDLITIFKSVDKLPFKYQIPKVLLGFKSMMLLNFFFLIKRYIKLYILK